MILLGDDLEVVVERKKIKNIYFRINELNQIYVTCPKYVTMLEINSMLKNNKASLEKMYLKTKKRNSSNDKVLYLGKELNYVYYKKVILDLENNTIYAPSIEHANLYLEKNSLPIFQSRMDIYIKEFNNLPKFRLRIRKMTSRWGVCNKGSMTVTLNTALIHKYPHLIDYVICHELSHFEHMNHSDAFWNEVSKHYPEYKKARKELRD